MYMCHHVWERVYINMHIWLYPRYVATLSAFLFKCMLVSRFAIFRFIWGMAKLHDAVTYLVFGVVKLTEWHIAQAQSQRWRGEMLSIFFWHLRNEYWQNNTAASTWRHDILLKDIVWPISILWFRTITHCTHRRRAVRISHANCRNQFPGGLKVRCTYRQTKRQYSHAHFTNSRKVLDKSALAQNQTFYINLRFKRLSNYQINITIFMFAQCRWIGKM